MTNRNANASLFDRASAATPDDIRAGNGTINTNASGDATVSFGGVAFDSPPVVVVTPWTSTLVMTVASVTATDFVARVRQVTAGGAPYVGACGIQWVAILKA